MQEPKRETFDDNNQIISLNVGGTIFVTTVGTLTKVPLSMLAAMFSGKYTAIKDEGGNYFIDRDGLYFRYILK